MPQLRVFRSNRIELLARLLGAVIRDNLPADPLQRIDVLVGSGGMARWLRHALAEQPAISICANFDFPFPAARIDTLVDLVLGVRRDDDEPRRDPWSPDTLMWVLLDVLPSLVSSSEFALVRRYVPEAEAWQLPADALQLGLAREIAALIDRYVTFRPSIASDWSAGRSSDTPVSGELFEWQPALWRAVQERLAGQQHRADRLELAVQRLRSTEPVPGLAGPLYVFGVSSLPVSWLRLLSALTAHAEVDLFLLCPSPAYWADLHRFASASRIDIVHQDRDELGERLLERVHDASHPLLVSMGKVARDFQLALESQPDHFIDDQVDAFPDPAQIGSPSLLSWIQSDLRAARHPARAAIDEGRTVDPKDDSVQLHSCHGPTRQVEVLRNVLLGLLEDHPALEPRQIVVMTPDIETYAPLITAVFAQGPQRRLERQGQPVLGADGWGPAGAPEIPFEIVDLSVRRINPVADALIRVLELADSRLPASAVVDLLTLEPVRQRFGFSADDVTRAQRWIEQSGIRWGLDASHRQREDQPADPQNTWRFGLRRLLLGVVMADEGALIDGHDDGGIETQVLPFDDMEGTETVLLGRLVDFCNTLFEWTDKVRAPRRAAAWVDTLNAILDEMTATSRTGSWLNVRVRQELRDLTESAAAAGSSRDIRLDAIRSALEGRFDVPSRWTREQSGAVTFCAMRPMRSVPYQVVCLLGMDEDSFPRKGSSFAFDLTAKYPRVGDIDPRDEDRFLLLEAVLAARSHLVVLYTGRDPRSNAPMAPCVPIAELRDLVDQTAAPPLPGRSLGAWLTTEHPLQAFSPSAFAVPAPDAPPAVRRRWSFDRRLAAAADARFRKRDEDGPFFERIAKSDERPGEVTLDDLIRFFQNPSQYLLRRRLKLDLNDDAGAIPDREPIELNGLDRWKLRRELAKHPNADLEQVQRRLRAQGTLPLGYAGQAAVQEQADLIVAFREAIGLGPADCWEGDPIVIDLAADRARVTGSVPSPYHDILVTLEFNSERPDKLIAAWIGMLATVACGHAPRGAVVAFAKHDKKKPVVTLIGLEPPDNALEPLARLIQVYQRGVCEPIPLFPRSSWAFAKKIQALGANGSALFQDGLPEGEAALETVGDAFNQALAEWEGSAFKGGDVADPYVERLYQTRCPLCDEHMTPIGISLDFARLASEVWGPVARARKTTKDVRKWFKGVGR